MLPEVYACIQGTTDITGLSALLNYVGGNGSNQEAYDGYHDSKFYKFVDSACILCLISDELGRLISCRSSST